METWSNVIPPALRESNMAPVSEAPMLARTQAEVEALFAELAEQWHRETDLLSSLTQKAIHPTYQRIIGLGPAALPLIFRELEAKGGHWYWALRAITGDDPTLPEDAGKIAGMREAWLDYGREWGYL
jgi:hypothetical protein